MTKLEFMKELESLLSDIPLEEREEALQYYNGYFEDAGEDHEEEIIKELVSPKRVASIIKADLNSNAVTDRENRGYFTEKGYQDTIYNDEKYEIVGADKKESQDKEQSNGYANTANAGEKESSNSTYQQSANNGQRQNGSQGADQAAYQKAQQNTRNTNVALLILVLIFGFPFIMSAFGILIGVIAAIGGIIIGFGVAGIALVGVGLTLFITGLVQISIPFTALLLCGSGLITLGLGMLLTLSCVLLCKKVLPALIRGIVAVCKLPFKNRSVIA
jgi:uncharacterized membrane protein